MSDTTATEVIGKACVGLVLIGGALLGNAGPADAHVSVGATRALTPVKVGPQVVGVGECDNPAHGHNMGCSNAVTIQWRRNLIWYNLPVRSQAVSPRPRGSTSSTRVTSWCPPKAKTILVRTESRAIFHGLEGDKRRPPTHSKGVRVNCASR